MTAAAGTVAPRFTPEEIAELTEQALARGLSLTRHVHDCALDGMRRAAPGVVVRKLDSGGELTIWGDR